MCLGLSPAQSMSTVLGCTNTLRGPAEPSWGGGGAQPLGLESLPARESDGRRDSLLTHKHTHLKAVRSAHSRVIAHQSHVAATVSLCRSSVTCADDCS